MEDELDEIMRGAAVSSYSNFASIGLNSALASFIIFLIGASAYGVVSAIQQGSGVISTLVGNLRTGLNRTIPRLEEDEKRTVVISCMILTVLELVILLGGVYVFRSYLYQYTFINQDGQNVLIAGMIFIFCFNLFLMVSEILRAYKKIPETNLVEKWVYPILQFTVLAISSLFFAMSSVTVLYALSISVILALLVGLYVIFERTNVIELSLSTDAQPIFRFITYTGFVAVSGIFTMFQFTAPNILVFSLVSVQAGAFGIAMLFGSLSRIPLTSINMIFPQIATELYDNNEIKTIDKLFKSTSKIALFFTVPFAMLFSIFHKEVIGFFSKEYIQYSEIIPIIISGQVIAVMAGTVGLLILMTDNEKQNILLQFIGSTISLAFIIPLTLKYNVFGLAAGYAITLTINNLLEVIYLKYKENIVSITKNHLKILSFSTTVTVMLYLCKMYIPLYVSIVLVLIAITTAIYINYRLYLTTVEQKAIITYKKRSLKYMKNKLT